jgi:lysophospholipase L1-like esterase
MKLTTTRIFTAFLALACNACYAQSQDTKQAYSKATDLTIIGKLVPTKNIYHRIDTASFPDLPAQVKRLLTNSTGQAVVFKTNSSTISAKWCVSAKGQSANMSAIGYKGLDLYIKKNGSWVFAGVGKPSKECNEGVIVHNMDASEKECLLYMPIYDEIRDLEIGVDEHASISPSADPFKKRILIYGSSILQGAAASRPGMAYPARLSRETGLNFLNLGLSGSAKMEKAAADLVTSIPADAYILDCVPNSSPDQVNERTAYLIDVIRKNHPKAPIIMVQSIVREGSNFDQSIAKTVKAQNENFRAQFDLAQKKGIKGLYFVSAENMLGNDHEGTADGTHPNDLGFDRMLQVLKPVFLKILSANGITAGK